MPTIDEVIGQRLQARRELMGRSSDEFAAYLGIAPEELEQIEAGARRLGPDLMRRACEALDVMPSYFFTDDDAESGGCSDGRNDKDDVGVRH
jgi:transcriptional regulator with XRE-family HTH domain